MTLFNGNEINWKAYDLGYSSCKEGKNENPFTIETDEWYSWNKGFNTFFFE